MSLNGIQFALWRYSVALDKIVDRTIQRSTRFRAPIDTVRLDPLTLRDGRHGSVGPFGAKARGRPRPSPEADQATGRLEWYVQSLARYKTVDLAVEVPVPRISGREHGRH
jgi:hypothetical protein